MALAPFYVQTPVLSLEEGKEPHLHAHVPACYTNRIPSSSLSPAASLPLPPSLSPQFPKPRSLASAATSVAAPNDTLVSSLIAHRAIIGV